MRRRQRRQSARRSGFMLRSRKTGVKSGLSLHGRQKRLAWLFLLPSLLGVMVFVGVPFLDVVRRSFCDAMGRSFAGFKNYSLVWHNQAFHLAAANTLRVLGIFIPLLLFISFFLALTVSRGDTKHGVFRTSIVLPMAIPVASMVLVWKIVFCTDGLLNQFMSSCSGQVWDVDWVRGKTAFPVLAVTYLWKNAGYDMLLWLAGLSAIPKSLYEAAKVDGAGAVDNLRYITLPLLKGTFGMVLILSVVNSFRIYREAYLLAGAYPSDSIYLLPHLFSHWFLNLDVQKMTTASVMMTVASVVPVLAVRGVINRIQRRNGRGA